MNDKGHEDRLDAELRRAINTTTPAFDAETWQRKYDKEFSTLLARGGEVTAVRFHPARWFAVAAVLVAAGYGLVCWTGLYRTQTPPPSARVESPAQLVTMSSLSSAFRRGGMEALDKQLDEAVEQLGPRPMGVPTARLLTDLGS